MKKLLLGLGTIAAVAVPTVAVVSCSLGSVFKSKINSVGEAQKDLKEIFGQLSKTGTLDNSMDKYTSWASANDVIDLRDVTTDQLKGVSNYTDAIDSMKLNKGQKNFGFSDWTGTHNDFYSNFQVTLRDSTKAYVTVLFKYDKTNGVWAGRSKMAWLINGAVAVNNATHELKHVISGIIISKTALSV